MQAQQAQTASNTAAAMIVNEDLDQDFGLDDFDGEGGDELEIAPVVAGPREDREARSARIAADLPDEEDRLIAIARESLEAFDQAIRSDDPEAEEAAHHRYQAVIWKLNGGEFFGCFGEAGAAGYRVTEGSAAVSGQAPLWGQKGEWLMDVAGMRVLVQSDGGTGTMAHHYTFNAIDVAQPFLSETGYRSYFGKPIYGATVEQAVAIWIKKVVAECKRPPFVEPKYRKSCAERAAGCVWLKASGAAESKPI
jgi:hypothetical protein